MTSKELLIEKKCMIDAAIDLGYSIETLKKISKAKTVIEASQYMKRARESDEYKPMTFRNGAARRVFINELLSA